MMRGGAMLLVAAAPLTAAFGIVGYPSSVKVWSYPANTIDDAGLGRGLAYVIDHDVCPSLLPNFVENQRGYWTIDCTMVKDTIHRAFGTWGANSHSVSFYDNTPPSYESSSTRFSEIYVTTSTSQTEPVTVTLTTSPTAPRSTGSTSGITLDMNNTMTITKAVITLAAKPVTAWYLDTGICDGVMRHESDIVSFAAFVVAVFVIVGLAIFCFLLLIQCIDLKNRNLLCAFTGYCRALFGIFTYPFTLTLVIFLLVFPGYIYAGILRPCVDDYPIEAAMLNAIGGSLGIADLSVTGTDLAMKTTGTFPEVCGSAETLLDRVQPAAADFVPCDYAPEGTPGGEWWKCDMAVRRASVMLPANPARTLTQLTQDDLDALNSLYPSACGSTTRKTTPLSVDTATEYAGWVAMMSFMLPLALLFCILPCFAVFAGRGKECCTPDMEEEPEEPEKQAVELVRSKSMAMKESAASFKMGRSTTM